MYLIGYTVLDQQGLNDYLTDSDNLDFLESIKSARESGLSDGEILCSLYAKLCYNSLTLGKNLNVTRVRDIPDNLRACFNQGHGSVFEHVTLNFVIRNCSRVYTHEQVRHRVGTSYSQESGRFCRGDKVDIVFDPILEPVESLARDLQATIESYYKAMVEQIGLDGIKDFSLKKKITSALRRFLPNGQSNQMGFSANLRTLRHLVTLRTSRHAEWEIRLIFESVYNLVKDKYPLLFYGAKEELVDGILEITGMKMQPYELTSDV